MLQHGRRPTIASRHGMVAAAHPLAAAAGARILANGGTAFDAAAATAAALNVVEPYMSGLAAAVWRPAMSPPRSACVARFHSADPAKIPGRQLEPPRPVPARALAVGAPGNLAGWCEMVRAYGRKKLPEIFAPAIGLARDGYPLIEFNVEEIQGAGPELRGHPKLYPEWARVYTDGTGTVAPGFVLKQPDLAGTLEALAAEGPGLLYGGALGEKMVARLAELGGCLTMDDLLAVKPHWIDPLSVSYRGHTVHMPPPPCEGFQFAADLAHPRRLRPRQARSAIRVEHVDTVLRAIRLAAGVRIANSVPSPQKLAETPVGQPRRGLRARVRDGKPVTARPSNGGASRRTQRRAKATRRRFRSPTATATWSASRKAWAASSAPASSCPAPASASTTSSTGPTSIRRARIASRRAARCRSAWRPRSSPRMTSRCWPSARPAATASCRPSRRRWCSTSISACRCSRRSKRRAARLTDGRAVFLESRVEPAVRAELRERGHDVTSGPDWTMKVGGMQGVAVDPATGSFTGGCDPRRDGYCVPA